MPSLHKYNLLLYFTCKEYQQEFRYPQNLANKLQYNAVILLQAYN